MKPKLALGFDVGGTFTDFVLLDQDTGEIAVHKCLSTPSDPSRGVMRGFRELLGFKQLAAQILGLAVHSSTVVSNAIIERKGAKTLLLTTRGFRDTIEFGTEQRYDVFDEFEVRPEPLAPRALRLEVDERTTRDGAILKTPNIEDTVRLVREACKQGVQSVAIVFLHSYKNSENERSVAEAIRQHFPDLFVSASYEVAPQIREYERSSTTIADAYVKPIVAKYLRGLVSEMGREGFRGQFQIMMSDGGRAAVETAETRPIRMLESGPSAGALAATFYGNLVGQPNLLSLDVGGTTAKACLIEGCEPSVSDGLEVARVHLLRKGSGIPIVVPTLDMIEIGAGGGSIAWVDEMGLLKVGPHSSGADPGPACYGLGGKEPTASDANLLLGYLNADYFLGGRMKLDVEATTRAVGGLSEKLGLGLIETAWGIHAVMNEYMAAAARIHVIEKRRDPRNFTLLAYGGAGPIHATGVARALGTKKVIAPFAAGVTSALGCLASSATCSFVRSYFSRLDDLNWEELESLYDEMKAECLATLATAGIDGADVRFFRSAEMRLAGQINELSVSLPSESLTPGSLEQIKGRFWRRYEDLYRRVNRAMAIEVLHWRLKAVGPAPEIRLQRREPKPNSGANAMKGTRQAYFPEAARFVDCAVYDRYQLVPGARFVGPAAIEERESTVVAAPGDTVTIDEYLNLVIEVGSNREATDANI